MRTHGWVTGVQEYGVFVSFYDNVRGLIHVSELGLTAGQTPSDVYREGQSIKVTVLTTDPLHKRLKLSIRKGARAEDAGMMALAGLQVRKLGAFAHASTPLVTFTVTGPNVPSTNVCLRQGK